MVLSRPLRSGRDLHDFLSTLENPGGRTLDEYLRALWRLGTEHHRAGRRYLTAGELGELLAAAFDEQAPPFDPQWRTLRDQTIEEMPDGFATWESTVRDQILDLDELVRAGLADESGSFFAVEAEEVDAPGGGRWSHLDPRAFLTSACVAFGEDTLPPIDWDNFASFLCRGQRKK